MVSALPRDPTDRRRAGVVAVPHHPGKGHAGVGLATFPSVAVHHRQPLPEDVNPRQATILENRRRVPFEERQTQKHDNDRRELERLRHKRLDDHERRVGDNSFGAGGHLRRSQEVVDEMQSAVIEHVRRNHGMAMVTQYIHYRTATSGGLPKLVREPFDRSGASTATGGVE